MFKSTHLAIIVFFFFFFVTGQIAPDPNTCLVACPAIARVETINGQEVTFGPCCFGPCKLCVPNDHIVCVAKDNCQGNNCFYNGFACHECERNSSLWVSAEPCPGSHNEEELYCSEEEFFCSEEEICTEEGITSEETVNSGGEEYGNMLL